MNVLIRELTLADYDQVMNLWTTCEGIGLSSADTQQAVGSYLERNPHLSRVAEEAGRVAAAVLCGHDGRRGYLYHLAVRPVSRGRGIGRRLVQTCLVALQADGIQKCHAFVFRDNLQGVLLEAFRMDAADRYRGGVYRHAQLLKPAHRHIFF